MRVSHALAVVWVIGGCASHVAPQTVPTRVAPVRQGTVTACWVEFADNLGFTASGILLRHPSGEVLVDAGQSFEFPNEIEDVDFGEWWYLRLVPAGLTPDLPASAVLGRLDVQPSKLAYVLATHAHSDHIGGLMDLPEVPLMMAPEEIALLQGAAAQKPFNVVPGHAARLAGRLRPVPFEAAPYEIFDRHADLFGDGSVVVVPLSGHTPGSVGVFVNTGAFRILHVGDALNEVEALRERRGKGALLQRTDMDPERADAVVGRLAALAEMQPELRVLPAHERSTWVSVFGEPGACRGR